MKTILRIAKLELNNLFYSPIAWLVLVGFSIYTASAIVPAISLKAFSQGLYAEESFGSITQGMLISPKAYFNTCIKLFMVLIPLLAMGVISREASTGSIKLLYSSPIKLRSIVIGKYMAVLTFVLLLTLIAFTGLVAMYFSIDQMEVGTALSGLIGLFFLGLSIAAITVFVSTFSAYPIVDAVATIAIVFGLDLLYGLVKEIPVINEVVYWISPSAQITDSLNGLLTSKAIGYYVVLSILFVLLSITRMNLLKQTIKGKRVVRIQMLGLFAGAAAFIYILIQPALLLYTDMTSNQSNRISSVSMALMAPLKNQPIKITTYCNLMGDQPYAFTPRNLLRDKLRNFSTYYLEYPQIQMEYVYYYNPIQKDRFVKRFMLSANSNISLDSTVFNILDREKMEGTPVYALEELPVSEEIKSTYGKDNFRIIESNGKQTVLMTQYDDMMRNPSEAEKSTAFSMLVKDSYLLAFVKGHGERDLDKQGQQGWKRQFSETVNRDAYINNGFNVSNISLQYAVPENIDVLVIADPKTAYTEQEQANLESYIQGGGHLLLAGEPGSQLVINPLLQQLGVSLQKGMVVTDNPAYKGDYVLGMIDHQYFNLNPELQKQVQMPTATALSITEQSEFTYSVLLKTKENEYWLDQEGPNKFGEVTYQPEQGDKKEVLPLMVSLKREVNGKSQYIIVSSDADYMSEGRLSAAPAGVKVANFAMSDQFSKWFTNGEYPLNIPIPIFRDKWMKIDYEDVAYLKWIYYLLLPGIFLGFGLNMLMKRMRK